MADENDSLDPSKLELSLGDFAHSSVKGAIGTIPVVGSFLSEVFSLSKDSPFEKRKKEFILALANKIEILSKQSRIDVNSLKNNSEFHDIIIQTYEIAIKNSQKEKLQLLQNVVVNSALGIKIPQDEKLLFLDRLDRITPSHYRVLQVWYNPKPSISQIITDRYNLGKSNKTVYTVSWPEMLNDLFQYDEEFYKAIIRDLNTWNLIHNTSSRHTIDEFPEVLIDRMMQNTKVWHNDFGKRFMDFVASPVFNHDF